MEPAQAVADLTEISTQIEGAVLASRDGSLVASSYPDERAREIAENAVRLFDGAAEAVDGGREPSQVEAATREGCVFVVRDERHVVAAVTGPDPTAGLVFYDLKTCLRQVADARAPKPKRTKKKESGAKDA
ncbi:MAG TPA: roadblock/LC7 domain-containing protein [Gaiellaceae bacterium]